jgi:hypothetical protein
MRCPSGEPPTKPRGRPVQPSQHPDGSVWPPLHAGDEHGDRGDLGLWITAITLAAPCAVTRPPLDSWTPRSARARRPSGGAAEVGELTPASLPRRPRSGDRGRAPGRRVGAGDRGGGRPRRVEYHVGVLAPALALSRREGRAPDRRRPAPAAAAEVDDLTRVVARGDRRLRTATVAPRHGARGGKASMHRSRTLDGQRWCAGKAEQRHRTNG